MTRRRAPRPRAGEIRVENSPNAPFVAIDFETADYGRDSACAVGIIRVENNRIVHRASHLIRPPRSQFVFTWVHGITWEHVRGAPAFAAVWRDVAPILNGAEFLAAHNASFDRSVLRSCCLAAGIEPPAIPFQCTVALARSTWEIRPTTLPNVCSHLRIGLRHHDALSDAEACAQIVLAARAGFQPLKS